MKKITTLFVLSVLGIFLLTGNAMAASSEPSLVDIMGEGWDEIYVDSLPGDFVDYRLTAEYAGYASRNEFGVVLSDGTTQEIFLGSDVVGDTVTDASGGVFYLSGPGGTFYSDEVASDGVDHFKFFENKKKPGEYYIAVDDVLNGDGDYNDMVVHAAVPIPGAVWLLGSGLAGLVGIRRKFLN
jgi:hypothetical protein